MNITEAIRAGAEVNAFYTAAFRGDPETSAQPPPGRPPLRNMANYRPLKKAVNVRLDADVIEWLQSAGKGYQTRMNAILRNAMLRAEA